MNTLAYGFNSICRHNSDGSYATQYARKMILKQASQKLRQLGYRQLTVYKIRRKHVLALLEDWMECDLSTGTIKNRMSHLRWALKKIGRTGVIPPGNRALEIPDRKYITNKDKSVDPSFICRIQDPYIQTSLWLCHYFGLRREESMKIVPKKADKGSELQIEKSKGNRPRCIPIKTPMQRFVLNHAIKLARSTPQHSLIPTATYVEHLKRFEYSMKKHETRAHGLRHGYAQRIYQELTGWVCPAKGGPLRKQLSPKQHTVDKQARMKIMRWLGHGESRSPSVYLGT